MPDSFGAKPNNMKWISGILMTVTTGVFAGNNDAVQAVIDLTSVQNDKVQVVVDLPDMQESSVVYCLPKIVPGTYSIYDFGRFVSDFKAIDKSGAEMAVEQKSVNEWKIANATQLDKVSYWVEDTYDATYDNPIFEPAGTNIEEGKNYLLNTFGFIGYVQGQKENDIRLTVRKRPGDYGVSPLQAIQSTSDHDIYHLDNYDKLADAPLMYGQPDTASIMVGGAQVQIGVYSPNGVIQAAAVRDNIKDLLHAQELYLGGKLPVEKYAFIFYFTDTLGVSGGMGALEHMNSSVYFLPEMPLHEEAVDMLRDVCAHEFFHIVTPLNIHSHEIADFNFIEPHMSEHLWLYEGQTEYAAHHAQVMAGLITPDEFLRRMQDKIDMSQNHYNDSLSFTEMSRRCLDEYKPEYTNVYQKGALINMCLDIELRELSGGKYGTRDLMRDLGKEYGMNRSFNDDELFDKIAALTYPEIRTFFAKYVEGNTPIPYEDYFARVGVILSAPEKEKKLSMGNVALNMMMGEEGPVVEVVNTDGMNAFGKELGYEVGDRLVSINGVQISEVGPMQAFESFRTQTKAGDPVAIEVMRTNKKGKTKLVTLKGTAMEVEVNKPRQLVVDPHAGSAENTLRSAWLTGS